MNVQLTPHAQEVLQRHLSPGGGFRSPEELIEHALDLLDTPEPTLETLRAKIQAGLDDIAAGRAVELNGDGELDQFFNDIQTRGRERLARQQAGTS